MSNATTLTTADALRAEAARHEQNAADSFDRCDTDGFVSQWASGLNARVARLQATIVENGGTAEFPALLDLDGNLVPAKLINGRFGMVWGLLASDDPQSEITSWVSAFPKRESTMRNKGFAEGHVRVKAKALVKGGGKGLAGAANCFAGTIRLDGGFDPNAEVAR